MNSILKFASPAYQLGICVSDPLFDGCLSFADSCPLGKQLLLGQVA